MRITRQAATELVVVDSSLWIAAISAFGALSLFCATAITEKKGNLVCAGFFAICSLICIRRTRFVFDARARVVRWKNLLFLKASTGSLAFDDIRGIGIEASSGDGGSATYRLTILTSQKPIPLAYSYSPGSDKYAAMREAIVTFLNLQPDGRKAASAPGTASQEGIDGLEPSILELVRTGRTIDAITLLRSVEKMSLSEAKRRVDEIKSRSKAV